jgi:hypothetical protein
MVYVILQHGMPFKMGYVKRGQFRDYQMLQKIQQPCREYDAGCISGIRYQYCFPRYDNIATLLSSPNVGPARATPKPLKYPHSKNNSRRLPNIYNLGRQFLLEQITLKQITLKQFASKQFASKQFASE